MSISKSPNRHTFQADNYVNRCKEEGTEPREDYLNVYKSARQQDAERIIDPEWQKDNLEYDLRSTEWILEKTRASKSCAQNLYAALCNNDFQRLEMWPILTDKKWHCSWRYAGGIIADMREEGDYIDWYCSGIGGGLSIDDGRPEGYVPEGQVTEEIAMDLHKLGWVVVTESDDFDL
jgi:hypothetical protein